MRRLKPRPSVETLEGRTLLSTVTDLLDSGVGSLRQAIVDTPTDGTINFQPGLTGTITLTSGELYIGKNLQINGNNHITVDGNNASIVFDVGAGINATIRNLTITHGSKAPTSTTWDSGGVDNFGQLTLNHDTITNNTGSGIINHGTIAVNNTIVSYNTPGSFGLGGYPPSGGGGIANESDATITNSTIDHNFSAYGGGGIANDYTATNLTLINTTISDNVANYYGGGIWCWYSNMTMRNSTVVGNSCGDQGGGILVGPGMATITHSLIASNTTGGEGGGLCGGSFSLSNDSITNNSASYGGGMSIHGGPTSSAITDCIIGDNHSTVDAGGVRISTQDIVTINNSIIANNTTDGDGGGIGIYDTATATIRGTLITDNTAGQSGNGGGIYNTSTLNLSYSIVIGNTPDDLYNDTNGVATLDHDLVAILINHGTIK